MQIQVFHCLYAKKNHKPAKLVVDSTSYRDVIEVLRDLLNPMFKVQDMDRWTDGETIYFIEEDFVIDGDSCS